MKKIATTIILSLITIPCFILPLAQPAFAQVQLDDKLKPQYAAGIKSQNQAPSSTANLILQMLAGSLIYVAGPLGILILAYGGLRYVTSYGDQTQMEDAKKTITYAIIGLIVIIFSWAIVSNVIKIIESAASG